jgi:hypothetical protein
VSKRVYFNCGVILYRARLQLRKRTPHKLAKRSHRLAVAATDASPRGVLQASYQGAHGSCRVIGRSSLFDLGHKGRADHGRVGDSAEDGNVRRERNAEPNRNGQ